MKNPRTQRYPINKIDSINPTRANIRFYETQVKNLSGRRFKNP